MGIGLGPGVAIGAWLGILLDNLTLGIAMGTGVGVAFAGRNDDGDDGDG